MCTVVFTMHFIDLCEYVLRWRWKAQQTCWGSKCQDVSSHCCDRRLAATLNSRSLHLSFLVAPSSLQWKWHRFFTGWAVVMCGESWGPCGLHFAQHKLLWLCAVWWSVRSLVYSALTVSSFSLKSLWCCVHYWRWGVIVSLLWPSYFSPRRCPFWFTILVLCCWVHDAYNCWISLVNGNFSWYARSYFVSCRLFRFRGYYSRHSYSHHNSLFITICIEYLFPALLQPSMFLYLKWVSWREYRDGS